MNITVRIAAVLACGALVASGVGLVSPAFADNGNTHGSDNASTQPQRPDDSVARQALSATQITAVNVARKDYITAAAKALKTYRDAMTQIRVDIDAATADQTLAVLIAADAYRIARVYGGDAAGAKSALDAAVAADKAAREAARTAASSKVDAANLARKTALDAAKTAYATAINAAFAGGAVPQGLLNPPGGGRGVGMNMGAGMGAGMGMGSR